MKNAIPQVRRRKIGSVVILDIQGELVGPWALQAKDSIAKLMNETDRNFILNLKEIETIDSLGVKAVVENIPQEARSVVIGGRNGVMDMFEQMHVMDRLHIFKNEEAVIDFFGKDFIAKDDNTWISEQRVHDRLSTAVPLEFWYENKKGIKVVFRGIITDLSVGGLFSEYLDLETTDVPDSFDPTDIEFVTLKIKLPGIDYISASGKVLRTVLNGEQVGLGMSFTDIADADKEKITNFLSS